MASTSARIVVVGSANTDLVVRVPALPRPGETVIGGTFVSVGGGKGANQAVAAARSGGSTTLIAKLGADAMGDAAVAAFAAEGIDTTFISRDLATASGVAFILVDDRGENSIAVASGANDRLLPADIDRAHDAIRAADMLLVQLEIPLDTVRHAVAVAHAAGVPVILNPAPARPLHAGLLAQVAILTPNETEAELLTRLAVTDEPSAAVAAGRLIAAGPRSVVITLGRRGAVVAAAAAPAPVAGHDVAALDTVAAGDVFNGCLAVALAEGKSLVEAAAFANAAAAIAVTRHGAQASAPRRDEILMFQSSREVPRS
ncbi:MAG: ribokinase [Planctomycetia bacterium]